MSRVELPPRVDVRVDGAPLSGALGAALASVRIEHALAWPAQCALEFHEPPGDALAAANARIGSALELTVGADGAALFSGEITALECARDEQRGSVLRWRAYDRLHRLRKRAPVRAFDDVDLAALARALVEPLGLAVELDVPTPRWRRVLQAGATDLELLVARAARCGLFPVASRGRVRFVALSGAGPELELAIGRELRAAEVEINADTVCSAVAARGWETAQVRELASQASFAHARAAELAAAGADEIVLAGLCASGVDELEAIARATLARHGARAEVLRATANGDARFALGARVRVDGMVGAWPSAFTLTNVVHRIDLVEGFVSELSSVPPAPPRDTRASIASLGVVSDVADPEQLGRVRVELRGHGAIHTEWLQVVCPAAGAGKGIVALPDVGDQVVLLSIDGDLDRAVVVGGLFGASKPHDVDARRAATSRLSLCTRDGHRLVLDEVAKELALTHANGSSVHFTADHARLVAHSALTIEAPGQRLLVRADRIDFERA